MGSYQSYQNAECVAGALLYTERPVSGERLYSEVDKDGQDVKDSSNLVRDERTVEVHDIRTAGKDFSLQRNGFELHKLHVPADIDWSNSDEVKEKYYPAAEALLKQATGATRVHIFDHVPRNGKLKSGPTRLFHYIPEDAERLVRTPFAILQVWRPLKGPVRSSPLGIVDAETVEREDLSPRDTQRPERLARTFALHHNPNHRWYYAEGINTDEAYVFVCYDSRADRARFTPHCAFRDLSVEEDAPPRESVELRSYVFWENEEPAEIQRDY